MLMIYDDESPNWNNISFWLFAYVHVEINNLRIHLKTLQLLFPKKTVYVWLNLSWLGKSWKKIIENLNFSRVKKRKATKLSFFVSSLKITVHQAVELISELFLRQRRSASSFLPSHV